MNETTKTSTFIAVAIILLFIAVLVQPREPKIQENKMVGKTLFEEFNDALAIKGLQIVKYDARAGEAADFRIAEIDSRWCIPSCQNYPADAKEQMAGVVAEFYDKQVLSTVFADDGNGTADIRDIHAMYGVLDPSVSGIHNAEEAGIKVTLTGDSEKVLVNVIIGKEVEGHPAQRYVRIPDQNSVHTIETSTASLSTKFDDWIEKNLLEISSFDFDSLEIDDYDIDLNPLTGQMAPRIHGKMLLRYDAMATGPKWNLTNYTKADPETNTTHDAELAPGESLNEEKLDQMRTAFNDLKIVNVQRVTDTLAKSLRENDINALLTEVILQQAGFHPAQYRKKDGTAILKLVSNQGALSIRMKDGIVYQLNFGDNAGTQSSAEAGENTENPESASIGMNRYLLVLADFDESLLEKPELQPLPEIPENADDAEKAKLQKERDNIEQANKRLEEVHQQRIDEGRKKVEALNRKFANWFYVISEDVFKKLHLTDADLIVKGTAAPSGLPKTGLTEAIMPTLEKAETEQLSVEPPTVPQDEKLPTDTEPSDESPVPVTEVTPEQPVTAKSQEPVPLQETEKPLETESPPTP
ncbi:MAG: DUF4340 domain-containing protein [Planctomycetaceae bacterium]|jgi:hypothetical protein|nr:DUF4340 domain-containing protein [Planctomycetaceae bacterium]